MTDKEYDRMEQDRDRFRQEENLRKLARLVDQRLNQYLGDFYAHMRAMLKADPNAPVILHPGDPKQTRWFAAIATAVAHVGPDAAVLAAYATAAGLGARGDESGRQVFTCLGSGFGMLNSGAGVVATHYHPDTLPRISGEPAAAEEPPAEDPPAPAAPSEGAAP